MKKTTYIIIALFFSLLWNGCTDKFEEINTSPTMLLETQPDYFLTKSLKDATWDAFSWQRVQMLFGNHYAQFYANCSKDFQTDRYESNDVWATDYWNLCYSNWIANIEECMKLAREEGDLAKNKVAIARIWRVFIYQRMTDFWGDIPYSEACMKVPAAYDTQEFIYKDMLTELDEAVSDLDPDNNALLEYGEADILYQGDVEKWQKFGNSLRLRLALRISDVEPALAQQHISDVINSEAGVISQAGETARMIQGVESVYSYRQKNPIGVICNWNEFRVSKLMIDKLKQYNDPRLPVYARPAQSDGEYHGLTNGLNAAQLAEDNNHYNNFSNVGILLTPDDYPMYVLTHAEVCFLRAEAALKGWTTENAKECYENGIRASLNQYWITDEDSITAYLNEPAVAFDETDTENAFKQIMNQKWLALFNNGLEAWSEIRRTGYPELYPIPNQGETGSELPLRVKYPVDEQLLNSEHYNKAASRFSNGDQMTSSVWWDTK